MTLDLLAPIKGRIQAMDKAGAELELARLSYGNLGRTAWEMALTETARANVRIPTLLGFAQHFEFTSTCSTAYVNLKQRKVYLSPQFICEPQMRWEGILFFLLHEKEHVILHTYFGSHRKPETTLDATDNLVEDIFVNVRVRSLFEAQHDPTQWYYEEYGEPGSEKCIESHGAYAALRGDFSTLMTTLQRHHAEATVKHLRAARESIARATATDHANASRFSIAKSTWEAWSRLDAALRDVKAAESTIVGLYVDALSRACGQYSTYPLYRQLANAVFHELRADQLRALSEEKEDPQQDAPPGLGEAEKQEDEFEHDLTDTLEMPEASEGSEQGSDQGKSKGKAASSEDEESESDAGEEEGDSGSEDSDSEEDGSDGSESDEESDSEGDDEGEEGKFDDTTEGKWDDWKAPVEELDEKELEQEALEKAAAELRQYRLHGKSEEKARAGLVRGINLGGFSIPEEPEQPKMTWVQELLNSDTATAMKPQKNGEPIKAAVRAIGDSIIGDLRAAMDDAERERMVQYPTGRIGSREMLYLGNGMAPPSWREATERKAELVNIYADVSGSMEQYYALIPYVMKMLAEMGGDAYQFSGDVVRTDAYKRDIYTNGHTDYNVVAAHIIAEGSTKVIVLTDHTAPIQDSLLAMLGEQLETLYLISTPAPGGPFRQAGFRKLQALATAGKFPGLSVVDVPIPAMLK